MIKTIYVFFESLAKFIKIIEKMTMLKTNRNNWWIFLEKNTEFLANSAEFLIFEQCKRVQHS